MTSPKERPPDAGTKKQHSSLFAGFVRACLYCFLLVVMMEAHASAESKHRESASASALTQVSGNGVAQDARSIRLLRNAGVASLVSVIGIWIFISAKRLVRKSRLQGNPITFRHALGKLGARPLTILDRVNRAPRMRISALLSALACIAASAILAILCWSKAMRLGPGLLESPWQYAMLGVGFSVSAVMLVICAVCARTGPTAPLTPVRNPRIGCEKLMPWVLASTCILMLLCFRWLDLWNSKFNEHSWHYTLYGVARLLFMPFLAAALLGAGDVIINQLERRFGRLHCTPIERTLTAFLCGTGAWYVILLPGSLAGFLQYHLIAPLFILTVWFSASPLVECGHIAHRWLVDRLNKATLVRLLLVSMPIAVILGSWTHLLVDRGLAITGLEYDSYGHYVPYYRAVVEHGSTDINELWYHFWISKGAALHLLATLLTDIHGPQLVSFTLLTATAFMTVVLIFAASGSTTLGFCAGAMFLAPFTHGFPYYQKHHIVTVALIGGLLWLVMRAWMRRHTGNDVVYSFAISLIALASVINAPPIAAVLCVFLILMALTAHFAGFSSLSKRALFTPVAVAGTGITIQLALNHITTGLMEVTPFRLFWNLANQSSFSTVVSPYLLLFASEGTSPTVGNAVLDNSLSFIWMRDLLHLQFLQPHLVYVSGGLSCLMIIACFADRKARHPFLTLLMPTILLLASAATLALFVRQPGSIERFYLFNLLAAVLLAVCAPVAMYSYFSSWNAEHPVVRRIKSTGLFLLALMMVTVTIWNGATWLNGRFYHETTESFISKLQFATGQTSFRDTLLKTHIPRDPSQWPKREISEECLGAMAALQNPAPINPAGSPPRVWTLTFLQEAGCHVLPGIRFMMEFSNRFGSNWHRIVFGDPATALHELELIGIRHVYVNLGDLDVENKAGFSTAMFGCLAYSPLLDPAFLKSRFRIAWQHNEAYLLVLAGNGQETMIPDNVAKRFAEKRATPQPGLGDMAGICARLAEYYHQFGENWPVHADSSLPPLKGWQ